MTTTLVEKKESRLAIAAGLISALVWLGLIYFTLGKILLLAIPVYLLGTLFHSLIISHLKGNGVEVTAEQFPDLHQSLKDCADKIGMKGKLPRMYITNGNGVFNAFASHFLATNFITLYSNVVDALTEHPQAIRFYIGHELGHLHRAHTIKRVFFLPALLLPILGQAYSRACEHTCDRYGLACCDNNADDAKIGLSVLACGAKRWQSINLTAFKQQIQDTRQFWMSFNELISSHPWTSKRCQYVEWVSQGKPIKFPRKNPFAYLLAIFFINYMRNSLFNLAITMYIIIVIVITVVHTGNSPHHLLNSAPYPPND